jgi:hypothetical protein
MTYYSAAILPVGGGPSLWMNEGARSFTPNHLGAGCIPMCDIVSSWAFTDSGGTLP